MLDMEILLLQTWDQYNVSRLSVEWIIPKSKQPCFMNKSDAMTAATRRWRDRELFFHQGRQENNVKIIFLSQQRAYYSYVP